MQFILQLAEGRAGFVQGLLFREPSKFAWSDMYEDHFYIMNQRIVMVTTKRIMLLKVSFLSYIDSKMLLLIVYDLSTFKP